jgi:hypothetical protein
MEWHAEGQVGGSGTGLVQVGAVVVVADWLTVTESSSVTGSDAMAAMAVLAGGQWHAGGVAAVA